MKYIIMVAILLILLHTFSFAKYNWSNKNRIAAVGTILLSVISLAISIIALFFYYD